MSRRPSATTYIVRQESSGGSFTAVERARVGRESGARSRMQLGGGALVGDVAHGRALAATLRAWRHSACLVVDDVLMIHCRPAESSLKVTLIWPLT